MKQDVEGLDLKVSTSESCDPQSDASSEWIDITVPINNALTHWPGDPPVLLESISHIDTGAGSNLSRVSMGSHTGTHIDAPRHFIPNGERIENMALDRMIGIARVIEIRHKQYITKEELSEYDIRSGERLLFKTRNSTRKWYMEEFNEDFVSISKEAADLLAQKSLKMLGIDYLSVGGFRDDGSYIHRRLLESGCWLLEGIYLEGVKPGNYFLNCLPLKLASGDGAPGRALLKVA